MVIRTLSNLFRSATTPPNTVIYAVGDKHGYIDAALMMDQAIEEDRKKNPHQKIIVANLGDYVNRGPDSRAVIDHEIDAKLRRDGVKRIHLRGNHDKALEKFFRADFSKDGRIDPFTRMFFSYGGMETLASYGVQPVLNTQPVGGVDRDFVLKGTSYYIDMDCLRAMQAELRQKMPSGHVLFLEQLKNSFRAGNYLLAHAGIDPEVALDKQDKNTLTGVHDSVRAFMNHKSKLEDGVVVVHGHTVTQKPFSSINQVSVDTGVYRAGHGKLTCAVLRGSDIEYLQVKTNMPSYEAQNSPTIAHYRAFSNG